MSHSYVPYTEKAPGSTSYESHGMYDVSDATRNAYMGGMGPAPGQKKGGMLNPMNWKLWQKIVGAIVIVAIIVAIIVGAVLGSRANRYPSYSKLNYSVKDTFSGSSFFDNFDYFNTYDPTAGFVHYDSVADAKIYNTTYTSDSQAFVQVDVSQTNASTGRHSARVSSKNTYNDGLFVFDIQHTPYGCGTWPAIWLVDQANWPYHGEIDIVEAVNQATTGNQMTLHTTDGCTMQGVKREETGTVLSTNCLNSTDDNAGCGVQGAPSTFGPEFNANAGGVYATELRSDGIRTWFWPRSSIPSDVSGGSPDPSSWGTALADFPNTDCDIGSHFQNLSITINVDLCGSWAGSTAIYSTKDGCPGTCEDLVANNATAFKNAFWEINSIKVYQSS